MAAVQLLISKPLNSFAASFRITAFTTKVNKPKVKMLIGKVKNNKRGLNKKLKKPITAAANKADEKDLTMNPGTR